MNGRSTTTAARAILGLLAVTGLAAPAEESPNATNRVWEAPGAGVVQTRGDRLAGRIEVRPEGLAVGDKTAAREEVLFAVFDRSGRTLRQPNTVRLTNGEVWHCEILALTAGKLKVHSQFFGTKEVDKAGVRALEFQAKLAPEGPQEADVLYRQAGEPLPGKVLWIDRRQVAVDSPLGAIALDREGLTRFILSKDVSLAASSDEADVVLADGTVLRGQVTFAREALKIDHAALGGLTVPAAAVRSLLRHPAWAAYLTELAFTARSQPLESGEPPEGESQNATDRVWGPRLVEVRLPGEAGGAEECPSVRCLVIQPATQLVFGLSGSAAGRTVFRATLASVAEARGESIVRVLGDGKVLLEKAVSPWQAQPAAIAADLGGAAELRIEVSFGRQVRFPCGVVLGDPHLVAK